MISSLFRNPMAQKRYERFKSMKRACLSLWILVLLYGLSLFAELLCNNVPLYVHFDGQSFFPVVRFYPEATFTGSGRHTRPDYKALQQSPQFSENSENYMIFPPFRFSPLEDIDPASIQVSENVTLVLRPIPHVGSVDIRENYSIVRSSFLEFFIEPSNAGVSEMRLD